ncbi:MAG: hypothetical protein R6X18_19230 [Chloroflexota bacterium]|jgi:hypothetical protein
MNQNQELEPDVLAETELFAVWRNIEEEGAYLYHVELGGLTLHLSAEEWEELVLLVRNAST